MERRTAARVVRFGRSPAAQVRATDVVLDAHGCPSFCLVSLAGEAPVQLAVPGEHQVSNVLAATAVALELGATPSAIAAVLRSYRPVSRWRMEVTDRSDGVTVVNDAYNANPESVAAALRTLVVMAGAHRRSWAVLGPLAELGEAAGQAYREIGALTASLGVDRLVVVGEQAEPMQYGAAPGSVLVPDVPAALELLHGELIPGDVVLIKASRSFGLERIAGGLLGEIGPIGTNREGGR
jgi:UDP-N-acetylmuramoyl-tripeptide--D-alanyl-D-alanine ligase